MSRRRRPPVASGRRRRLRDSEVRRRWWARAGVVLAFLGALSLGLALLASRVDQPEPIPVDADGATVVPRTYPIHNDWVLFAAVDDPRRVPALPDIGCRAVGFSDPRQPEDMTFYGARVVDETSIAAVALLGRSGGTALLECAGAAEHAPLLLAPSSQAPPFAPSALVILGAVLLVAAVLAHPATEEVPGMFGRVRRRREE